MERPEAVNELVKTCLSLVMEDADAEKYLDVDGALRLVKQGLPTWQAPASIGIHAGALWRAEAGDVANGTLGQLVGYCLEPMEALLETLVSQVGSGPSDDVRNKLLYHTRFGLGLLLLAKGDVRAAAPILHDMASTRLSWRNNEHIAGPGVLEYARDTNGAKWLAAAFMEEAAKRDPGWCREASYLATEAYAGTPSLLGNAVDLFDRWATRYEKEDSSADYESPSLEWADLFAEMAEVLSLCDVTDPSGALPGDCDKNSAQFVAHTFGKTVGRFATGNPERAGNLRERAGLLFEAIGGSECGDLKWAWLRGPEKTLKALYAVVALLCEYGPNRDWQKLREHYVEMWERAYSYRGTRISEIGPESDLYWAMRIGLVDKVLENVQLGEDGTETAPDSDIKAIRETISFISLTQVKMMKLHQDEAAKQEKERQDELAWRGAVIEGLPPSRQVIREFLQGKLARVWDDLPSKVMRRLCKAERLSRDEASADQAIVEFAKAVEACVHSCLTEPLLGYARSSNWKEIAVCFPPPQGVQQFSPKNFSGFLLPKWCDILDSLAITQGNPFSRLTPDGVREFLAARLGGPRLPDLRPLAESLRKVQRLRGPYAHERVNSTSEAEEQALKNMRELVLGIGGRQSVICLIFQMLAPRQAQK